MQITVFSESPGKTEKCRILCLSWNYGLQALFYIYNITFSQNLTGDKKGQFLVWSSKLKIEPSVL